MGPCMAMSFENLWNSLSSDSVAQVLFQCAGRPSRRDFGCGRWTQSQMNWELHLLWMLAILDVVWRVAVQCLQYVFLKGPISKGNCKQSMAFRGALFHIVSINQHFFFTASAPQSPGPFAIVCHVTSARDGQFPRLDEVEWNLLPP